MEPYHLTLSQVNVEEQELGESSAYEDLYSFSNLVSFDSDFQLEEDTHAVPVIAKRIRPDQVTFAASSAFAPPNEDRSASESIHSQASQRYLHNFYKLREEAYGPAQAADHTPSQADIDMAMYRANKKKFQPHSRHENNSLPDRYMTEIYPKVSPEEHVVDANITLSPNDANNESFKSFTDTVEALALQQSVIGKKGIKPASADEIERAIAATKKRMQGSTEQTNGSIASIVAQVGNQLAAASNAAKSEPENAKERSSDQENVDSVDEREIMPQIPANYYEDDGSLLISMTGGEEEDRVVEQSLSDKVEDSAPARELIRIPADEIVTVIEKGSTWFSGSTVEVKSHAKPYIGVVERATEASEEVNENTDENDGVRIMPESNEPVRVREDSKTVGATKEELNGHERREVEITKNETITKSETVTKSVNISQNIRQEIVTNVTLEAPKKEEKVEQVKLETKPAEIIMIEPKTLSSDSLQAEIERLLREKAKLEGHIEILEAECNAALRERAQLQSQVAAVTQQLRCQETAAKTATDEREALSADYETLRQNRSRLEQAIVDSNRLIQDKDEDIQRLQEDLRIAKETEKSAQNNIKTLSTQIQNKETTLSDLKGKIAEVYVSFQTSEQNKILLESEITSLRSENKTLQTSKAWYMEQLSLSQESKNQLQHDITKLKAEIIANTTLIEKSRAENVRLKNALKETEQQALEEKEQLAKHLETIEADLLEREATFAQIHNERLSMENLLSSKQHKEDDETVHELTKAQNELRRSQAQVKVCEHQQAELNRRLTLAQESILQRDQTIEALEQKLVDRDLNCNEKQQQVNHRDADISKLNEEKMALEVELRGAKEEKTAFDNSLQTLRSDMSRLESSFRQMHSEIEDKDQEIIELKMLKEQLEEQINQRPVQIERVEQNLQAPAPTDHDTLVVDELVASKERLEEERSKLREHISKLEDALKVTRIEKSEVEQSLGMAEGRVNHMESRVKQLIDEKAELEGQLLKTVAGQASDGQELKLLHDKLKQTETCLTEEKERSSHIQIELHAIESKLKSELKIQSEHMQQLESDMKAKDSDLSVHLHNIETLTKQLKAYEDNAKECDKTVKELKSTLVTSEDLLRKERSTYEERLEGLVRQLRQSEACNDRHEYETKLQEMKIRLEQADYTLQQERNEYELRLQEMVKIIRDTERKLKETMDSHNAHIAELNSQIDALKTKEEKVVKELKGAEEKAEILVTQRTEHIVKEVKELNIEISVLKEEKIHYEFLLREASQNSEKELADYRAAVDKLQVELQKCQVALSEAEKAASFNRELSLELEKERGRLAGLQQTYSSLKDHNMRVEAALADRESSVMELSSHADMELSRQNRELNTVTERLKEMESLRNEDLAVITQLKSQLTNEREQHSIVRRDLEAVQRRCIQLEEELDAAKHENQSCKKELGSLLEQKDQYKLRLDQALEELQKLSYEQDLLKQEVDERSAKDPVQVEEMKTLQWKLNEKDTEISALKDQVKMVNDRQSMEMNNLQAHIHARQAELQNIKSELAAMKRDKNSLQAKVAELKGALRVSVQHVQNDESDDTPKKLPFDLAMLEKLLQEPAPVSQQQSKPLSVLQDTLSGLRSQISSLQSQFDEHTSAVQNSSMAWKDLEAQVQDLREVCRSSAAERAASQNILENSRQFTEHSNSPPPPSS